MSLDNPRDVTSPVEQRSSASSLLVSAHEHARAGYPVLPVMDKKPLGRVRRGTTDPAKVDQWWGRFPMANVGINLDGLGVVVIDVDGHAGEESLTVLLTVADVTLPDTYEVRTGRGRHLWFRLPPGCPALASQTGGRHGPELDIKCSWLVTAAWSNHKSGYIYQPNRDRVPTITDLVELPRPVYDILAAVGHLWEPTKRRSRRKVTAAASKAPPARRADALDRRNGAADRQPQPGSCKLPTEVRGQRRERLTGLLADTSDGRNARSFQAVRLMVWTGCTDEQIHDVLLSWPLGAKARQSGDTRRFVQQKIESARRMVGTVEMTGWDPWDFWLAVHQAGLTGAETRLLDALLNQASHRGVVTRSQAMLGIGSALSPPSVNHHLKALQEMGWVTQLLPPEPKQMRAATYGLTIPPERQNLTTGLPSEDVPPTPHPAPLIGVSNGQVLSLYPGHDAFRNAKQSPGAAYPLLCLLGEVPQTTASLVETLGIGIRTVQRHLNALREAGLVVSTRDSHRLTDDLDGALDEAARRIGTCGRRQAAIEAYHLACQRWAEQREERTEQVRIPGTHAWLDGTRKDYRALLTNPVWARTAAGAWDGLYSTVEDLVDLMTQAELAHRQRAIPIGSVTVA